MFADLTHYLWTRSFEYAINPKIPTEGAEARIADVGAGTGSAFRSTLVRLEL